MLLYLNATSFIYYAAHSLKRETVMWDKVQNREGMYFLPSLPLDSFALTDEGEQRNRFFYSSWMTSEK